MEPKNLVVLKMPDQGPLEFMLIKTQHNQHVWWDAFMATPLGTLAYTLDLNNIDMLISHLQKIKAELEVTR